jgi:hypothetical protein
MAINIQDAIKALQDRTNVLNTQQMNAQPTNFQQLLGNTPVNAVPRLSGQEASTLPSSNVIPVSLTNALLNNSVLGQSATINPTGTTPISPNQNVPYPASYTPPVKSTNVVLDTKPADKVVDVSNETSQTTGTSSATTSTGDPEAEALLNSLYSQYQTQMGIVNKSLTDYSTNVMNKYNEISPQLQNLQNQYGQISNLIANQTGSQDQVLSDLQAYLAQRANNFQPLLNQTADANALALTNYQDQINRLSERFRTSEGYIDPAVLATAEQARRPDIAAAQAMTALQNALLGQYGEDVQRGLSAYQQQIQANQLRQQANLQQQNSMLNNLDTYKQIAGIAPTIQQQVLANQQNALSTQQSLQDAELATQLNKLKIQEALKSVGANSTIGDPFTTFITNPTDFLEGRDFARIDPRYTYSYDSTTKQIVGKPTTSYADLAKEKLIKQRMGAKTDTQFTAQDLDTIVKNSSVYNTIKNLETKLNNDTISADERITLDDMLEALGIDTSITARLPEIQKVLKDAGYSADDIEKYSKELIKSQKSFQGVIDSAYKAEDTAITKEETVAQKEKKAEFAKVQSAGQAYAKALGNFTSDAIKQLKTTDKAYIDAKTDMDGKKYAYRFAIDTYNSLYPETPLSIKV